MTEVSTQALVATETDPTGAPETYLPTATTPIERSFNHGSHDWRIRAGAESLLARVPNAVWQNPVANGWTRIKQNSQREVWRATLGGKTFYLKYYRAYGVRHKLRHLLGRRALEAEWKSGLYALRMGIPAVRPVACTPDIQYRGHQWSLLITEALEPTYTLDAYWNLINADDDPRRRRHDVAKLANALAKLIAHAHQAGFEHLDMHAANILVHPTAPGDYRVVFVDLQSARLGRPIRDAALVRNLAQLNQWFRQHSSVKDRIRFLRRYFYWRNEFEHAYPHARRSRLSFQCLVAALHKRALTHARALNAQRDRRLHSSGRYFGKLRLGGWTLMYSRGWKHLAKQSHASGLTFDEPWWRKQLQQPLHWFKNGHAATCKESHSGSVCRATLKHPSGPLSIIIKRPRARNWRRRISQWIRPSRSWRGWRMGHILLHRRVATAPPLAVLEKRLGPFVLDSLLITEAIPGAEDLDQHLRRMHALLSPARWRAHKRDLIQALARTLRQLENAEILHRDCKANNILVVREPHLHLMWVDMDGLRLRKRPLTHGERMRALLRLHVSLCELPGINRSDCLRLLRAYSTRWGANTQSWRVVWRELERLAAVKRRKLAARRAWKRKRYGRT